MAHSTNQATSSIAQPTAEPNSSATQPQNQTPTEILLTTTINTQNPEKKQPQNTSIVVVDPQATSSSATESASSPIQTEAEIAILKMQEEYASEKAYTHINTKSSISEQALANIRQQYLIPLVYELCAPKSHERMYYRPDGWTAIPLYALRYGVRFPLHEFISTFLGFVGIGFAQLVPNSYIHLICYIAFCHECGVPPAIDFFFGLFTLGRSKEPRFRQLTNSQSKKPGPKPPEPTSYLINSEKTESKNSMHSLARCRLKNGTWIF